jgi:hypothetical protein
MQAATSAASKPATSPQERRRSRRVKVEQRLRVRPMRFTASGYEDVQRTVDMSREGAYFLTEKTDYHVGMMVFVRCPYSPVAGSDAVDYVARIVRVEEKPNGRFGIALELLEPTQFKSRRSAREQKDEAV